MKALLLALFLCTEAQALTIIRRYYVDAGAPPTNAFGGGNLADIFNAAADLWEEAIRDDHVIILSYQWGALSNFLATEHWWAQSEDNPSRQTRGHITFDNDGDCCFAWWLDPTPYYMEEYSERWINKADLGGGPIVVGRYWFDGSRTLPGVDLLSVAVHEIGHALGLHPVNPTFHKVSPGPLVVSGLPFAGTVLPFGNGAHLWMTNSPLPYDGVIMGWSVSPLMRTWPSYADILVCAQLSQWRHLNLDMEPHLIYQNQAPWRQEVWVRWSRHFPLHILQEAPSLEGPWTNYTGRISEYGPWFHAEVPFENEGSRYFRLYREHVGTIHSYNTNEMSLRTLLQAAEHSDVYRICGTCQSP